MSNKDNFEQDIKVLNKLLNSELFLGKFPMIKMVSVYEYGNHIDIVMHQDETGSYWPIKDEANQLIYTLSKMAGIKSRFQTYP